MLPDERLAALSPVISFTRQAVGLMWHLTNGDTVPMSLFPCCCLRTIVVRARSAFSGTSPVKRNLGWASWWVVLTKANTGDRWRSRRPERSWSPGGQYGRESRRRGRAGVDGEAPRGGGVVVLLVAAVGRGGRASEAALDEGVAE